MFHDLIADWWILLVDYKRSNYEDGLRIATIRETGIRGLLPFGPKTDWFLGFGSPTIN